MRTVARLRAFGSGVLEPHGIHWAFDAPEETLCRRLSPDQRRQLYLILKEAIHNVARHSRATSARVSIDLADGSLCAQIEDDGCGYVPDGARLGLKRTPEVPANLAFGGPDLRTLFLTARTSVYTLRVQVPGQPHPLFRATR